MTNPRDAGARLQGLQSGVHADAVRQRQDGEGRRVDGEARKGDGAAAEELITLLARQEPIAKAGRRLPQRSSAKADQDLDCKRVGPTPLKLWWRSASCGLRGPLPAHASSCGLPPRDVSHSLVRFVSVGCRLRLRRFALGSGRT